MSMQDLSLDIYDPLTISAKMEENALAILEGLSKRPLPTFTHEFNEFDLLKKTAALFKEPKNIVVIGNGGSITSFAAYYDALVRYNIAEPKEAFVLNNMEPDIVQYIRTRFRPQDTLVIPISKSGNTVGVLEDMLALKDYPMLVVTTPGKGTMLQMAKNANWQVLSIPDDIGGRFSGRTHTGYLPAYLCGIDVEGIEAGAREATELCLKNKDIDINLPLQLAYHHYLLETSGFDQLYLSVYSQRLFGFYPLIIQLVHETFGKDGAGLTVYGGQGPEAQHHTNQRFFGGRKDTHGLFVTVEEQDHKASVSVPENLRELRLDNANLGILNNMDLGKSMSYESQGVIETARAKGIPYAHLKVSRITPHSVGEFLVFFHFYVYYSAVLRGLNPFDQPAVEDSKRLSFEMRRKR